MGRPGIHWTARLRGYEAMTILGDETILSTPGFPHADPRAAQSPMRTANAPNTEGRIGAIE